MTRQEFDPFDPLDGADLREEVARLRHRVDRLERAIANLHVPATIVRDMNDATMVMTLKNYYRQGSHRMREAEEKVAHQESIVRELQSHGHDTAQAERLLQNFREILDLARKHLALERREKQDAR